MFQASPLFHLVQGCQAQNYEEVFGMAKKTIGQARKRCKGKKGKALSQCVSKEMKGK
jgi:hypothetical protein